MENEKEFDPRTMTLATVTDFERTRRNMYHAMITENLMLCETAVQIKDEAIKLKRQIAQMESDIRSGAVELDCATCKGQGQVTEIERGNPYTARELRCSDCGATGTVTYKCVAAQ